MTISSMIGGTVACGILIHSDVIATAGIPLYAIARLEKVFFSIDAASEARRGIAPVSHLRTWINRTSWASWVGYYRVDLRKYKDNQLFLS